MLNYNEHKEKLARMYEIMEEIKVSLDLEELIIEHDIIQRKMTEGAFWDDIESSQKEVKRSKEIESILEGFNSTFNSYEDASVLFELANEEPSLEKELEREIEKLYIKVDELKIRTLLKGEYDSNNAILSIHAGSGGLDAQDWAKMLLRMYSRFSDTMDYKIYELDYNQDPEAGIKSVTIKVEGLNAYGYLKSEKGVHRLVRISPFDPSGKRHTSFASIDVIPELDDSVNVEINSADIKIDTYRASGAGGQHVNKTESAIRITHLPTGLVVQCQSQRSQHLNKEYAMKMLLSKLIDLKQQEHKERIEDLQGEYSQISWGSQIRSYVFQPYTLVKDHRTSEEVGNIQSVMDGNIMPFIIAYLSRGK
ncbi:MAG: peptide chain release factor 2 [Filifactoraceae bacterium]